VPAKQKHAKRNRPDPDYYRAHLEEQVRARRALCSLLLFWRSCGHKRCLRARACARETNDCFHRFMPLVPAQTRISLRAGMEASAAGLSKSEIAAAIARAVARWRATQAPPDVPSAAPSAAPRAAPQAAEVEAAAAPPRRIAAPAPPGPRVRML
jgi:hypothetical protein